MISNIKEGIAVIDRGFDAGVNDKVAGFDLDHTLIKPKAGKVFPTEDDVSDWEFYNSRVPNILLELFDNGYQILVISNQGAIKKEQNIQVWVNKVENIIKNLDPRIKIKVIGIVDKKKINYRKPLPRIWFDNVKGNNDLSFYCGDAAGLKKRVVGGIKLRDDFSDTDAKFAINCGVKFINRDDYIILGVKDVFSNYLISYPNIKSQPIINAEILFPFLNKTNIMIILTGYPGSGKTSLYKKYFSSYMWINNDTMTKKKEQTFIQEAFAEKKSIVIDNTNPSSKVRGKYINLAKPHGYKIISIHLQVDMFISMHNNVYRSIIMKTPKIPTIAYRMYKKNFEIPNKVEGFDDIIVLSGCCSVNNDSEYYYYYS